MVRSINLIHNDNNRLEVLRPLLNWMRARSYGVCSNGCFVVDSSLSLHPKSNPEMLFRYIQAMSKANGHILVCYCIQL